MHYLEDYLELMESLPVELRDRFADMRQMDVSVQNGVDRLRARERAFFADCERLDREDRDEEFANIRQVYAQLLEESGEKVRSVEECHRLVDKYLRKIDQELLKFKLELEADNHGITEVIEKRSLELDDPAEVRSGTASRKASRFQKKAIKRPGQTSIRGSGGGFSSIGRSTSATDLKSYLFSDLASSFSHSPGMVSLATPSSLTYPLQHMWPGANAISATTSKAIAASQEQPVPGRRPSSLEASFEAVNLGVQTHESSVGMELAEAALSRATLRPVLSMVLPVKIRKPDKHSQQTDPVLDVVNASSDLLDDFQSEGVSPSARDLPGGSSIPENSDQTWNSGPAWNSVSNEPRYCFCSQISYGDMVACDNDDCPYEWFHFPCVGMTSAPEGKWYCPTCLALTKPRK